MSETATLIGNEIIYSKLGEAGDNRSSVVYANAR
jgi:hypothetical protein